MTKPQQVLLDLLSEQDAFILENDPKVLSLDSTELADLFLSVAFLITAAQFLKEERWLQNQKTTKQTSFADFISELCKVELVPILFLQLFLEKSSLEGVKTAGGKAAAIEKQAIALIKSKAPSEQKTFATHSLKMMVMLFDTENKQQLNKNIQGVFLGLSMYRTFDRLDEIFNLNYSADHGMKKDLDNPERLYEGAGIGVQSSYLTILTTLTSINPAKGARFIDLGSGYGRLGIVIGLIRPDMKFIGYEFVKHRVEISIVCCENLGLQENIQFFTQDLSLPNFQIPEAEIYYMYDPFTKATYSHILAQLILIGKRKKIIIVTKGNARDLLFETAHKEGWKQREELGEGNLCFFESCAK